MARTTAEVSIEGVAVRQADYTDREGLEKSFAGLDALLLVSANGAPEPRKQMHLNVIKAVEAAVGRPHISGEAYFEGLATA